ncbi:MAG: hypothetical protein Satyrvirus1_67 [Satyrvirus sp.]|uniref:Uncharacterized protein n=1 Tax=Satyrvirus sp. TaxID=2487771 RepID=A0A3G5AFD0_9VIRU|nr:MAG: hypothetical protein Satyrvirus1_67 [Satyrvirus sp.]
MNLFDFYRGLIIVEPYGTYIKNKSKTLIIKSKKIKSIVNEYLLLIENKVGLGIIILGEPKKISLKQFSRMRKYHKISEDDRIKWWPNYKYLYSYPIIKKKFLKTPILLYYETGPQITILPDNIFTKKIFVGMAGYSYNHMYPPSVKSKNILEYYSNKLNSVEINSTFYHRPTAGLINNLLKYDLKYSIKVHKYITHNKKLKGIKTYWNQFYKSFKQLYNKILCFLFQFSSKFYFNDKNFKKIQKLSNVLNSNSNHDDNHYYAFEFRDKLWFNDSVNDLFKKNRWVLVITNVNNKNSWVGNLDNGFNPKLNNYKLTTDMVYIRMHGSKGEYTGSYNNKDFNAIVEFIKEKPIMYACTYFNNTDYKNYAFKNSLQLTNKFNYLNITYKPE